VSRDAVFRECPRKYYFNYYGYWNGWQRDAPRRTREIYVLKQLKTRAIWVGQVVHDCIARSLQNLSRGVPLLDVAEILSITRNIMRRDFRDSKSGRYRENPKQHCGLFEHEYDLPVADEQWKAAADDAAAYLGTFYASEHFAAFRKTEPSAFLEIEEFSSIRLDRAEIRIKLDCATREGAEIVVWDWKTGKKEADPGLSLQMGCYALYARDRYRAPLESVLTRRFDLYRGIVHEHRLTDRSLEEILAYIRGSIADMSALADEENRAEEEDFAKVSRRDVCRHCNFFKVCKPDLPNP
jgi:hypothetical protein